MRSGVGFWRGVFIIETSVAAARWKELGVSLFARQGMKDGKERKKDRVSSFNYLCDTFRSDTHIFRLLDTIIILCRVIWHWYACDASSTRTTMYFRKKIRAPLLFSKLLRTSWFLIAKLSAQVFVFLLSSGYLRKTLEKFPAARYAGKRIFAVSGIFAAEAKISLPSASVCQVNLISSYNN